MRQVELFLNVVTCDAWLERDGDTMRENAKIRREEAAEMA